MKHSTDFNDYFDQHGMLNYYDGKNYGDGFDSLAFTCMYVYYHALLGKEAEVHLPHFLRECKLPDRSFARHPHMEGANEMNRFSRDQCEQVLAVCAYFDIQWPIDNITNAPWFNSGHMTNFKDNDPTKTGLKPPDYVLPTTRLLFDRKKHKPFAKDALLLAWAVGKRIELLFKNSFDPTAFTTHILYSRINSTPFAWLARKFTKYFLPMQRMWDTYCLRKKLDGTPAVSPPPFQTLWPSLRKLL